MKELEKLIMALYKINHNLLRFSSPMKGPSLIAGCAPEPVLTSWRRETSCPWPESNPSCTPLCPSKRHGHSSDKNGVHSTTYPGTHCIGGLMGPRTGVDVVEERNILPLPGIQFHLSTTMPIERPRTQQ
jgi:hypothetical protein